jgi:hypothetical protein
MKEDPAKNRENLVSEAMDILRSTREKISSDHPLLLRKAQILASVLSVPRKGEDREHTETEALQEKNRQTVMKYLKIRYDNKTNH